MSRWCWRGLQLSVSLSLLCAICILAGRESQAGAVATEQTAAPDGANQDKELSPDEVLEHAVRATRDAQSKLRSAIAEGVFERHMWEPGNTEPDLWTKCKVKMHFDRGKYRLQFAYEMMLARTTYQDDKGGKTTKVVDWKPDNLIILFDGKDANAVKFSQRIRPSGCSGNTYSDFKTACVVNAELPWGELAELWKPRFQVGPLLENLSRDALHIEQTSAKTWLLRYAMKNSPQVKAEVDIDPVRNFHITGVRVFNPGRDAPAARYSATWKEDLGEKLWYVDSLEQEFHFPNDARPPMRERIRFESFQANVPVDPKLFELDSIEIPPRTRFLDRR
jgi:hypothetical protein